MCDSMAYGDCAVLQSPPVMYMYMYMYLTINQSINQSINLSIYLSIYVFIHIYIYYRRHRMCDGVADCDCGVLQCPPVGVGRGGGVGGGLEPTS